MMRTTSYTRVIGALVAAVLAPGACGGATASSNGPGADGGAEGGASDGGAMDGTTKAAKLRPGFTHLACGASVFQLAALTATPPFDYVELREQNGYAPKTSPDRVIDKLGTLCKTATNVAACESAFGAINHPVADQCSVPYPCTRDYLATTRGDEVSTFVAGRDDLGKVAAPIDTIDEAAFVVAWMRPALTCSDGSYRATADGFDIAYTYTTDRCTSGKSELHDVLVHVTRDGVVTLVSDDATPVPADTSVGCPAARRAEGVVYAVPASITDASEWLACAAHLEAASVASFTRLARELRAHRAPADLVARATRAARDERRHAQRLRRLARRTGNVVAPAPRLARAIRSLEAIAIENAVEGSSHETWGAVVVAHQAACASSAELRDAFRSIATDEAEHAELAADVAAWLASRLEPEANERVSSARRAAIATLAAAVIRPMPEAVRVSLGLPSPAVAARLFEGARAQLLAA